MPGDSAMRRALRRARPATEEAPARSCSTARPDLVRSNASRSTAAAGPPWRDASVNPFVAPPRVVQEREIPADVRGCCCGATGAPDDEPIIPVPVPLPFAFEEPPAPTPVPTVTTTTETSRPYASTSTTTTRDE